MTRFRMQVCLTIATCLASTLLLATGSSARDWPSAPFQGRHVENPPCTCRGPNATAEVGQAVCLATATGPRRARCVMSSNNTSWEIGPDPCEPTLTN